MNNSIILIAVAAFITGSATIAQADAVEQHTVLVRFADLDTGNSQGAAALYRRLKSAAESVCRDLEPGKEMARVRPYADCMKTAVSAAIVKIDRPVLTAYAAAHGLPTGGASIRVAGNR